MLFRTHHLWNSTTELILLCMSRKFRHIIVQPFGICSENLTTRNDIRWSQLLLRAIPTGILLKIRCRLVHWQKSDKKSSKITKTKYRKRNRGTLSLVNFSGRNSIRGFFDQNSDKNYGKIFVKILEGFSEKMEKILQIHSNKWPMK